MTNFLFFEIYKKLKEDKVNSNLIKTATAFNSGIITQEEYDSLLTEAPEAKWLRRIDRAHSNFQRFFDFAECVRWHLTPDDQKFIPHPSPSLRRLTN